MPKSNAAARMIRKTASGVPRRLESENVLPLDGSCMLRRPSLAAEEGVIHPDAGGDGHNANEKAKNSTHG